PPLDYKSRGLGVPLVFLLMGVLFVGGAYYAITGHIGWRVIWLSLPFSLLASLLLLSNELRDLEADRAAGIRTLSVRLGRDRAVRLYRLLLAGVYLTALGLYLGGLLPGVLALALTLPALWQPLRLLQAPPQRRQALTPLTGRLYALFSLAFLAGVWGLSP
ncbi:MAG TPA: prenyltransferase, partial [Gammaproteobacteria bacterium]|nr:prenyltransferase [Gammaproteobacteria bacterium]